MKCLFNTSAVLTCLTIFVATVLQETATAQLERPTAPQGQTTGHPHSQTGASAIRISHLMGTSITNSKGENVGEIQDLVMETKNGCISYAAVTYGGFLGFGNKLFAVPFEAIQMKSNPDDRDDIKLVLEVPQDRLNEADGFDKDNWPNFANDGFVRKLDQVYGVQRVGYGDRTEKTGREFRPGQQTESTHGRTQQLASAGANTLRASELIGKEIQNLQGKNVGKVDDLVMDARHGGVTYAAVTYGGFLGLGNKLFAVPFEAFRLQADPDNKDNHVLVLNVTEEQMEGAEGFDKENWPNFEHSQFVQDLNRRYNVTR